jgi:hypothetical protein
VSAPATTAAPRLLLGGDALLSRSRAPRDRALELAARYLEPESLAVALSKSLAAGADGVLVSPTAQLHAALALLKQPVPIYALLPHPPDLERDAAEEGLAGVLEARSRGAGMLRRMRAGLHGLLHPLAASAGDLTALVPMLLELEAPRARHVRGVVLAAGVTDPALAAGHRRFFERYTRFVHGRFGGLAGFETNNLGHLLRALREWSLAPDFVVGPVNPTGVRMKPSAAEVLEELRQAGVPVLAKELRGGGGTPLLEGARFARAQGVHGLVPDLVDLEDLGAELRALRAAGA